MGLFGKSKEDKWATDYCLRFLKSLLSDDLMELAPSVRLEWAMTPPEQVGKSATGSANLDFTDARLDVFDRDSKVAMFPMQKVAVPSHLQPGTLELGIFWLREVHDQIVRGMYRAKLKVHDSVRHIDLMMFRVVPAGRIFIQEDEPEAASPDRSLPSAVLTTRYRPPSRQEDPDQIKAQQEAVNFALANRHLQPTPTADGGAVFKPPPGPSDPAKDQSGVPLNAWPERPEAFAARVTDIRLSKLAPYRDSDPVLENFVLNHGPLHRSKIRKLSHEERRYYYEEMIRELRDRLGIWMWKNRESL
jgi:hypothetical protein